MRAIMIGTSGPLRGLSSEHPAYRRRDQGRIATYYEQTGRVVWVGHSTQRCRRRSRVKNGLMLLTRFSYEVEGHTPAQSPAGACRTMVVPPAVMTIRPS